jgi:hypothetical protein
VVAVTAILLVPFVAQADEQADARMQALEDRMRSLEDRLIASEATVTAQRELIEAHQTPDVAQGSALDDFFSGLEFGGYIDASYVYAFKNPDFQTFSQPHFQFNQNHNSFQLDAIKLELGKPASQPGTAGFQFDLLWGENAKILAATTPAFGDADDIVTDIGGNSVYVQEAYVSYNYDGVVFKLGKFETLLGYEVLDAPYNPHITHSELFYGAIPLFHTGLLASGNVGEGYEWAFGVVNGWNNEVDFNDNKGVLGRIGYSQEEYDLSVLLNAYIGADGLRASGSAMLPCATALPGNGFSAAVGDCYGDNNNRIQVYDLVVTLSPAENLDLWGEATYGTQQIDSSLVAIPIDATGTVPIGGASDPDWFALELGAIYEFNEKSSVALRAGYFHDDGNFRLGHGTLSGEADHYEGTVTLKHQLTDNLMARVEYRHDVVSGHRGTDDEVFFKHDAKLDDQQDIGILEVNYSFD